MRALLKIAFFFLVSTSLAFAQGVFSPAEVALKVVNGYTTPIANATITVCAANTGGIPCSLPLSGTIFYDLGLTQPLSNPFTSDAFGNYQFAAVAGTYTVTVSATGYVGNSYQLSLGGSGGGGGGSFAGVAGQIPVFTGDQSGSGYPTLTFLPSFVNGGLTFAAAFIGTATSLGGWCLPNSGGTTQCFVPNASSLAEDFELPPGLGTGPLVLDFGAGSGLQQDAYGRPAMLSCTSGQVEQYNGTAWACATVTASVGTGTAKCLAEWTSTSSISGGSVCGNITGQQLGFVNSSAPVAVSVGFPGTPEGSTPGLITASTYPSSPGAFCDSTTTTNDRGTSIEFTNATGTTFTVPDPTTPGCGSNFFFKVIVGSGAGTVTVNRTSSATFTVVTGSTTTAGLINFTLTAGWAQFSSPDNANWLVTEGGGGTTTQNAAQVFAPLMCTDTSSSSTTYTCQTTPNLTSLGTAGNYVCVIFNGINQANTAASSLNIDGIGAIALKKWQNAALLAAGDLQSYGSVLACYDGTFIEIATAGNGTGTVTVASGGSLTNNDLVAGAGLQQAQTPNGNCTLTSTGIACNQILVTGILDGQAPVTITTGASPSLGGTYNSGYTFNQEPTANTAVTYTLPAPVAGKQYCVKNSNNGSAADTGALKVIVANTGTQSEIWNGAVSSSGYITSGGAAGDAACFVGISSTQWEVYVEVGNWTLH
jgi:hypothetical protein